jgi:2-polyprenyl-3-methyl-5-hydroxy-6-metoxy-1,4-benzoquinol methylase
MDRDQLYAQMSERKFKPKDLEPYKGDNGRVNKCVQLFKTGALKKGGVLLDVGGGIGDLAYACRDWFDHRLVVDISSMNVTAVEAKSAQFIKLDVDKDGLWLTSEIAQRGNERDWAWLKHGESINMITALDFIEHIIDPVNFAKECFKVLKPGGEVFINTPNIRFWRHLEQLVYMGTFPHTSGDRDVYHGGHLAFYTKKDLEEIFGMAGFTGFERFKDEECYEQPFDTSIAGRTLSQCKSRDVYVDLCLEFGCPNLLFKAIKP